MPSLEMLQITWWVLLGILLGVKLVMQEVRILFLRRLPPLVRFHLVKFLTHRFKFGDIRGVFVKVAFKITILARATRFTNLFVI